MSPVITLDNLLQPQSFQSITDWRGKPLVVSELLVEYRALEGRLDDQKRPKTYQGVRQFFGSLPSGQRVVAQKRKDEPDVWIDSGLSQTDDVDEWYRIVDRHAWQGEWPNTGSALVVCYFSSTLNVEIYRSKFIARPLWTSEKRLIWRNSPEIPEGYWQNVLQNLPPDLKFPRQLDAELVNCLSRKPISLIELFKLDETALLERIGKEYNSQVRDGLQSVTPYMSDVKSCLMEVAGFDYKRYAAQIVCQENRGGSEGIQFDEIVQNFPKNFTEELSRMVGEKRPGDKITREDIRYILQDAFHSAITLVYNASIINTWGGMRGGEVRPNR